MKTNFQLSNLLGTVYFQGNLCFSKDGNRLFSPVGNRVNAYDLIHNTSFTIPLSHRRHISHIALDANDKLLLSIDEDGKAILTNVQRRIQLVHFTFRAPVTALSFSPSGESFIAAVGHSVELWRISTASTPDVEDAPFMPFHHQKTYSGHHDLICDLCWSNSGRNFLSCGKDFTVRLWSSPEGGNAPPTVLSGHQAVILKAWFSEDEKNVIYTLGQDNYLLSWTLSNHLDSRPIPRLAKLTESTPGWRVINRQSLSQDNAIINCAAHDSRNCLLAIGYSNGAFTLYEFTNSQTLQTLSISQAVINHIVISKSGELLALGAGQTGQLLVWDWQSESFLLKQQGHFDYITALAHSSDGQRLIAASDSGIVKIWDLQSGFCVVTFTEHTSSVTACRSASKGHVFFTSSLDGTVRAWDMIRYRNFRVFSAPQKASLACLAVDSNSEILCAGSADARCIFVWSIQTGHLLDQLNGHDGPVMTLDFMPGRNLLVSGSWDQSVRVWNVFDRDQTSEPLQLQSAVLDISCCPDSEHIAISTANGQLNVWSISESSQASNIDGRRDISGGRLTIGGRTAANSEDSKNFSHVAYSTDGSCLLAGGNSKYLCLYDVQTGVLLRKYTISSNIDLHGTQEFINSHAFPASEADTLGSKQPTIEFGKQPALPRRRDIRITAIAFSPLNSSFCVASSEGLHVFSDHDAMQFDPIDLDINVSPDEALRALEAGDSLRALVTALRLNEEGVIHRIFLATPLGDASLIVSQLSTIYLSRFLQFLASTSDQCRFLEFSLVWIKTLLISKGSYLQKHVSEYNTDLRCLQKSIAKINDDVHGLAENNCYMLDYLLGECN